MSKSILNSVKKYFIMFGIIISIPCHSQYPNGSSCQEAVNQFNSNYDAILAWEFEQIGSYNDFQGGNSTDFFTFIFEGASYVSGMIDPMSLLERCMDFNNFVYALQEGVEVMQSQLLDNLSQQLFDNSCYQ
jgi:hypothetical protein